MYHLVQELGACKRKLSIAKARCDYLEAENRRLKEQCAWLHGRTHALEGCTSRSPRSPLKSAMSMSRSIASSTSSSSTSSPHSTPHSTPNSSAGLQTVSHAPMSSVSGGRIVGLEKLLDLEGSSGGSTSLSSDDDSREEEGEGSMGRVRPLRFTPTPSTFSASPMGTGLSGIKWTVHSNPAWADDGSREAKTSRPAVAPAASTFTAHPLSSFNSMAGDSSESSQASSSAGPSPVKPAVAAYAASPPPSAVFSRPPQASPEGIGARAGISTQSSTSTAKDGTSGRGSTMQQAAKPPLYSSDTSSSTAANSASSSRDSSERGVGSSSASSASFRDLRPGGARAPHGPSFSFTSAAAAHTEEVDASSTQHPAWPQLAAAQSPMQSLREQGIHEEAGLWEPAMASSPAATSGVGTVGEFAAAVHSTPSIPRPSHMEGLTPSAQQPLMPYSSYSSYSSQSTLTFTPSTPEPLQAPETPPHGPLLTPAAPLLGSPIPSSPDLATANSRDMVCEVPGESGGKLHAGMTAAVQLGAGTSSAGRGVGSAGVRSSGVSQRSSATQSLRYRQSSGSPDSPPSSGGSVGQPQPERDKLVPVALAQQFVNVAGQPAVKQAASRVPLPPLLVQPPVVHEEDEGAASFMGHPGRPQQSSSPHPVLGKPPLARRPTSKLTIGAGAAGSGNGMPPLSPGSVPLSWGAASSRNSAGGGRSIGSQQHPALVGGFRDSLTGLELGSDAQAFATQFDGGLSASELVEAITEARNSSSSQGIGSASGSNLRTSSGDEAWHAGAGGFNSDMLRMSDALGTGDLSRTSADQLQMWLRGSLSGSSTGG